jgi:hypothetical protein
MEGRRFVYNDQTTPSVLIGRHGRLYDAVGNTQDGDVDGDGTIDPGEDLDYDGTLDPGEDSNHDGTLTPAENDGGCGQFSNPESGALTFSRVDFLMYPHLRLQDGADPGAMVGGDFQTNLRYPISQSTVKQTRGLVKLPPSPAPCPPSETLTNPGTGVVHISLTPCPPVIQPVFFRLYRGLSSGPITFLKDLGTSTSYTDFSTRHGVTYRYVARAYTEFNTESGDSAVATVTVTDTAAPFPPKGVAGIPGNGSATLTWAPHPTRDVYGFNMYMAAASGGPYTKMNSSPLPAWPPNQWVQAGLIGGQGYWFKVKALDDAGNESAFSSAVSVVALP